MKVSFKILLLGIVCTLIVLLALYSKSIFFEPQNLTANVINPISTSTLAVENEVINTSTIDLVVGGDMMFDRYIRFKAETIGYDSFFQGLEPLFSEADIVMANLEGSITNFASKTLLPSNERTKDLIFTFASSTAETLYNQGVSLVSLANNHTGNFGNEGLLQTHNFLDQASVSWFGDPHNISDLSKILCKKDICLAFVGYHEFEPGINNIIDEIKRLSNDGYPVIVMAHWGDEYAKFAPERIQRKAKQFVEAGAFAVVGAHPHVREQMEWINNVPVIYSLGNLIFDQHFNEEVQTGNIAKFTISRSGLITNIDKVMIYTISNKGLNGPVIIGDPFEFSR